MHTAKVHGYSPHPRGDDGWHVAHTNLGVPGYEQLDVYFHELAIADRMAGYDLDSPEDAIDALIREHVIRVVRHPADHEPELPADLVALLAPEGDGRVHELGGVHSKVTVEHDSKAKKQRQALIAGIRDREE